MIVNFDEFNSIPGIFYHQANDLKDQPYLWKKENDKYVSLSWSQVKEQVESLATYLKDLGILEGDRVLILSENRPYWLMADLAVMNAGRISVPIFTTYSSNDYEYILNDCKPSLIIVSNNDQFKKIKNHINLNEQKIISFEEIDVDSLLIKNILNEENYKKDINYKFFNKN